MYEDSEGGPKGSYENFKAEGDVLYKQGEYKKALESYNTALEIRPGEKNCLVSRAQCFLELGDSQKALVDAEEILKEEPKYIKGLLMKAESFYQMGQFEYALMFYHRGNKCRPEIREFRLGIQKSQEAIDNSIGDTSGVKLESKGDMEFFYAEQQQKKSARQRGGYKPAGKRDEKRREKERRDKPKRDPKTIKQLLGDLYADREYLEKLVKETENAGRNSETNQAIHTLALQGLDYLDTRTDFWQQQKPMYSHKRDKNMRESARGKSGKDRGKKDPTRWILRNLEEIDQAQAEGRHEDSLKQAKKVLKEVEKWSDDDISNRPEVVANLHSCIGNAYLELGEYAQALDHHNVDHEIASQKNLDDAKSRALDNLGRVHARMGKFDKAIEVWEEKLPLSKSALESTWLYHEIGRCYLEQAENSKARDYGEKSLSAAEEADDAVWQLNASVLIAQTEVKLGDLQAALDTFEKALDMAKAQGDSAAEVAIRKAIDDVNNRIVNGENDGYATDDQRDDDQQALTYEDDFEKDKVEEMIRNSESHRSPPESQVDDATKTLPNTSADGSEGLEKHELEGNKTMNEKSNNSFGAGGERGHKDADADVASGEETVSGHGDGCQDIAMVTDSDNNPPQQSPGNYITETRGDSEKLNASPTVSNTALNDDVKDEAHKEVHGTAMDTASVGEREKSAKSSISSSSSESSSTGSSSTVMSTNQNEENEGVISGSVLQEIEADVHVGEQDSSANNTARSLSPSEHSYTQRQHSTGSKHSNEDERGSEKGGRKSPKGHDKDGRKSPKGHDKDGRGSPKGHDKDGRGSPKGHGKDGRGSPKGHEKDGRDSPKGQDKDGRKSPENDDKDGRKSPKGHNKDDRQSPKGHDRDSIRGSDDERTKGKDRHDSGSDRGSRKGDGGDEKERTDQSKRKGDDTEKQEESIVEEEK